MENGDVTSTTAREAITILQGEMKGYYTNAVREDYGNGIYGPDFLVEGLGKFENITHVEVKNPVGSAIKIANGQNGKYC
jgi:inosine/xanthosine triphosphate pyrophosphatase family protein